MSGPCLGYDRNVIPHGDRSMKSKFILPAALLLVATHSFAAVKIKCDPASDEVSSETTVEDYRSFFSANKIVLKTEVTPNYVEQFKNEFLKFPESLRKELIKAGSKIHIMEGEGVTVDPTWTPTDQRTFDGRPWSEVPGAGGATARGYKKSPTRIVINHLYENHGSVNLFLHEHGHSLDSIKGIHAISNSNVWRQLKNSVPNFQSFLSDVCGNYCTNNIEEGFAEYFANYHGCEESREQMEREVPRVAEFFRRFTSTKNLDRIWEDRTEEREEELSRAERLRRSANRILGSLIPDIE